MDLEAGHAPLPTYEGRPNVPAILKDILEYEQAPEVSVHSAGRALPHYGVSKETHRGVRVLASF